VVEVSAWEKASKMRACFRGDADAGVVHRKTSDLAAVAGLGVGFDDHRDLAGGGELDAVGDEVDQHLAQPVGSPIRLSGTSGRPRR
jgi:hypothetical protein